MRGKHTGADWISSNEIWRKIASGLIAIALIASAFYNCFANRELAAAVTALFSLMAPIVVVVLIGRGKAFNDQLDYQYFAIFILFCTQVLVGLNMVFYYPLWYTSNSKLGYVAGWVQICVGCINIILYSVSGMRSLWVRSMLYYSSVLIYLLYPYSFLVEHQWPYTISSPVMGVGAVEHETVEKELAGEVFTGVLIVEQTLEVMKIITSVVLKHPVKYSLFTAVESYVNIKRDLAKNEDSPQYDRSSLVKQKPKHASSW